VSKWLQTSVLASFVVFAMNGSVHAQSWPSWADGLFEDRGGRPEQRYRREQPRSLDDDEDRPAAGRPFGGDIRDGGPRPAIEATVPGVVEFRHDFPANSIVIDTGARKLYYVLENGRAFEYAIAVGRQGFGWTGAEKISRKQAWPDWHPPAEMRERDPRLPEKMTGGLKNPLGAMALYLGDTLYRIHGTNDAKSIGRAESSGCFRMLNSAVLHLASITEVGTPVTVVSSLPAPQVGLVQKIPTVPASSGPGPAESHPTRENSLGRSGFSSTYRDLRDQVLGRE
jgi:lipoprotein-anchoring transpeptidase ErfK/SrfK